MRAHAQHQPNLCGGTPLTPTSASARGVRVVSAEGKAQRFRCSTPAAAAAPLHQNARLSRRAGQTPPSSARSCAPVTWSNTGDLKPPFRVAATWRDLGELVGELVPEKFAADSCEDMTDPAGSLGEGKRHLYVVAFHDGATSPGAAALRSTSRYHLLAAHCALPIALVQVTISAHMTKKLPCLNPQSLVYDMLTVVLSEQGICINAS